MVNRRSFLSSLGVGALVYLHSRMPIRADALDRPNSDPHIPADKELKPEWVASLYARGTPQVFSHGDLASIQMPISGICTGQELNLSGQGALAGWRLPAISLEDVAQGFALRVEAGGRTESHLLNQEGFPDMTFRGEYPIAKLEFAKAAAPVAVSMEAFSPYIPLETDDSGLPATIFNFTLRNTSASELTATLAACWENAVCGFNRNTVDGTRRNRITREAGLTVLHATAEPIAPEAVKRPDILFEDWTKGTFEGWTVEGDAFGKGPIPRAVMEAALGDIQGKSPALATSRDPEHDDRAQGKLTSAPFTIPRHYVNFWLGTAPFPETTYLALVIDGKPVKKQWGLRENRMNAYYFDVRQWEGRQATIEIVDASSDHDGRITIGRIFFSDVSGDGPPMHQFDDYGDMALALVGTPAELGLAKGSIGFEGEPGDAAAVPMSDKLIGTLGRTVRLAPGATAQVTIILAVHLPNLYLRQLGPQLRYYTNKFKSAPGVARYLAANLTRLSDATRLWRDTWYDSTLPYWFLDRTFVNASTPASGVCYRVASGRFYAFEGAPAPNYEGTCTHVWQYAHSLARTFPELERDTRERVDLGVAFSPNGVIAFRGEPNDPGGLAVDGQAGTILRFYREHQMAPDDAWLKRNWEKIKVSYTPLFALDPDEDGIMDGCQNNTLDCAWFGQVSWMSSEYCAAVRAGEAMAREMGDAEFAAKCKRIADAGYTNIPARLFNGEYFFSIPDPKNPGENAGDGSYIDQVFGEGWAFQVALPRILPAKETRTALASLWKYNFSPDACGYYNAHRTEGSAQYVQPGDAAMIMCTFPRTDWDFARAGGADPQHNPFAGYFVDSWTGQEYQVAGHMIWEGLVQEGLSIVRAIHDRYHPSKRNPWQEQEAGVHYSRAMASHGVFLAICGYEHHGPKGHLAFAPRLTPENFRAPFTAAEGWGTFSQAIAGGRLTASVAVKRGRLRLSTLGLALAQVGAAPAVKAAAEGKDVAVKSAVEGDRVTLTFAQPVVLKAGEKLDVSVG